MKINLRKANALQHSIATYVQALDIKNTVTITQFENADQVMAEALSVALNKDTLRDQLTSAMYTVRGLIGSANATAGVDTALTRAAYIDKRIAHLEQFIGSGERVKPEVLNGKLDKLRTRKDEDTRRSMYGYEENVTSSVFDVDTLNVLKRDIKSLKKEKQKINDSVLELNVRTEIDLPVEVVNVLTQEGLI